MNGTPRIDDLTPEERRELLGQVLRERRAGRRERPVSFAQQRLWFLDQLVADSAFYNLPVAFRLTGDLSPDALSRSLDEIVARHEVLRSTFEARDGEPVQVVADPRPLGLQLLDLTVLAAADREDELHRVAGELFGQPFDLARGPLLRARLVRLSEREHVLLLSVHHSVYDGWSNDVVRRELSTLHAAFSSGQPSPLEPLSIQYGDYAAWQRERLQGERLEGLVAHWCERLAGAPILELCTDHPRPPRPTHDAARATMRLSPSTTAALEALSRERGTTLFMTVLAAFQVLLRCYSGQDDVVVGTPVAGRDRAETEGLIGCFINSLVLRTDLAGDPTFGELVARVRDVCLDAFDHAELPFEELVKELELDQDLRRNPLFEVLFMLAPEAGAEPADPNGALDIQPLGLDSGRTRLDLELCAFREHDGLRVLLNYRTSLFDADTIERMLRHFGNLLAATAADPDRRLSELTLLDDAERRLLLEWNDTAAEAPDGGVHQLVAAQATRTPDAVAVVSGQAQLTYAELIERAAQWTAHLRARGVEPGDLVGIQLERGTEMVAALLGVLGSGAAYVPLDPGFPAERIAFMAADAGVKLVITGGEDVARAGGGSPPVAVGAVGADELAYVIYTSGSTGKPKGVQVPHGAVVNFLSSMAREPGLGPDDVLLAVTTLSFDISVLELLLPLVVGARVVVASRADTTDGARLRTLVESSGASVLQATPATWRLLLEAGWEGDGRLRALCGGEAWSRALADELLTRCGSLWNMYGPTEATVWSAVRRIEPGDAPVTVGRPIANMVHLVLEGDRRLVPVGVPGELYIGGAGLARGYLDRPELTAERFVANPFPEVPGARLYRTGDRVRQRPDGTLEFLGRLDQQVKLRGFRIELGEIEALLARQAGVGEAVALVREDRPGDRRLVAYVVPAEGGAAAPGELREGLRRSLPEYMVPSRIVFLDELPTTPNGKLDRQALPAPEADRSELETGWVAPAGPVEECLAGLWSDVLGVERIGARDSFFELGGHSLLATRLVSRIREAFDVELPLADLFERPAVAELAPRIEELRRGGEHGASAPIAPRPPDAAALLSFGQERFWFLEQLQPGTAAFNMHVSLRLAGALDVEALRRALTEVVRRHEVLRSVYPEGDEGQPTVVIGDPAPVELAEVDVSDRSGGALQEELNRLSAEEVGQPIDLTQGIPLRTKLLRLSDTEYVLLLTVHHIASDAWSMGVLRRELAVIHDAFASGQPSPLEPLSIQYGDYAVWQRERLQGERLEGLVAHWCERLAGAPVLELFTDRPRPPRPNPAAARGSFRLPESTTAALEALSRERGATLFMTVLAAFQTLLRCYSGQDDVVVGTPVAGRDRAETEGLVGCFINSLVLRTDLGGDPTFGGLVDRVREICLDAFDHAELPFEELVKRLDLHQDLSRNPLFEVLFVLASGMGQEPAMADGALDIQPLGLDAVSTRLDLELYAFREDEGLGVLVNYRTSLFDADTIERMLRHFGNLLAAVAADPDRRLSQLSFLDDAERRQLLGEWNDTAVDVSCTGGVHQLVAAQAARTPDAVAVVSGQAQLTYAELMERAGQWTEHLRASGVEPGDLVGIQLERGTEMVATLLGVLGSGAAYVPLDPGFPAERIAFMAADAGVKLVITGGEDVASAGGGSPPVAVGAVGADELAYVIYTSGSTGKPKGVQVPHGAVVNFLSSMAREPGLGPDDVLLAVTTLSFDISVLELLLPLVVGARVVVASRADTTDGARLRALVESSGASVLQATPATWRLLLEAGWEGDGRLRALCGGEAWSRDLADELLARCGALWNMYGPTEATVWSAVRRVEPGDAPVTVGRPIANTAHLVLDGDRRLVPVGVPGELFIGGAGLARGYLDRPELTAERFVDNPFPEVPGPRLYRTGDRVRQRVDGTLEFLGRLDQQVKLRGFRIELGEIEAQLARQAGVGEAVALVREDRPGDRRLVAYVVPAEGAAAAPAGELREGLRRSLPEYMLPSRFVFLDELPTTPNGKLDRQALPAPEADRSELESGWVAPAGPVEECLAGLWSDVLGVERVGARDSFFELGGHSLLATRLVSRIREAFDVELPLADLFERPAVADLAPRIEELRVGGEHGAGAPIAPRPADAEAVLSFGQERFWFLEQLQPGTAAFNMHVGLRLAGPLDVAALRRALTEIVRRHEVLYSAYPEGDEGQPTVMIGDPDAVGLAEMDVSDRIGDELEEEVARLSAKEASAPFDVRKGPVFRTTLLRLAETEHVLLLTVHHIVSDAWSMGILWHELVALYSAFSAGEESPLAEPKVQYADFVYWQRGWLQGERLTDQLEYWTRTLHGAAPLLELPTDRPRPAVESHEGAQSSYELDESLCRALNELAAQRNVTLFMVLLAGFDALLSRYTGQTDLVVGSPIAGRTRVETEDRIGLFVNSLVMRTDLSGDPTFQELVDRVRATCLAAYAHQDLPFERLVQALDPPRELSHHPVFQVLFVLQNAPVESARLPDLRLSMQGSERTAAPLDLTLFVWEAGGKLGMRAEYKTALFDEATIGRLLRHFERLFEEAVADPRRRLSELTLLGVDERKRMLVDWNATTASFPAGETLHGLVEEQIRRTPDAVAAVFEGHELTYRDLGQRAEELARRLRVRGMGPGERVALCVERGLSMLEGLLGILMAGAAYVPLDPRYPAERIEFILGDSRAALLVTQGELAPHLPAPAGGVLLLDAEGERPDATSSEAGIAARSTPEDLAYVIYTSGSTGRPKGVEIQHRAVVNFLTSMQREPGIDSTDVLLSVTTISFDIAVLELFLPLVVGARLVLLPREAASDGVRLEVELAESRATILQATPTTWKMLLEARWPGDRRLKALCGGEAWSRRLADELLPRCGSLWNMYGPTETTIWSAVQRVEAGTGPVAIGQPISNTTLYVLDEHRQPVPLGVPGELFIGGAGLARGYFARPDLTAERFVESTLAENHGARLYRTGDLVRRRLDGTLQFLGRLDHQVKVAGFRIELGEIESVLSGHTDVRELVVAVRTFGPDDERLVAYVVPEPGRDPDPGELRETLRSRLPDYMLPASFVTLEELPLTPNGKLDRAALPAPDRSRPEVQEPHLAPSTEMEERLAEIWCELLELDQVGVRDNFFDLGGHSLLSMRVVARLEQLTGVRINPGELILQTLGQLAAVCEERCARPAAPEQAVGLGARVLGSVQTFVSRMRRGTK